MIRKVAVNHGENLEIVCCDAKPTFKQFFSEFILLFYIFVSPLNLRKLADLQSLIQLSFNPFNI